MSLALFRCIERGARSSAMDAADVPAGKFVLFALLLLPPPAATSSSPAAAPSLLLVLLVLLWLLVLLLLLLPVVMLLLLLLPLFSFSLIPSAGPEGKPSGSISSSPTLLPCGDAAAGGARWWWWSWWWKDGGLSSLSPPSDPAGVALCEEHILFFGGVKVVGGNVECFYTQ